MLLLFALVSCACATCNLIEILVEDDNVNYKIVDQTCALSEIKSRYVGKRHGGLLLYNSRFTFDADLSMQEWHEGTYSFLLGVTNSTVIVDYPTRINMIEYETGEMILNRDMYAFDLMFHNSPHVMLNTIKTNSQSTLHVNMIRYQSQYVTTYNVPETLRLTNFYEDRTFSKLEVCNDEEDYHFDYHCPDHMIRIDAAYANTTNYIIQREECPQNCNQQCEICMTAWEVDQKCQAICNSSPIDCNERCPHTETECPSCPQCNCPVCEQCQQCQECPVCKNTTESSTVKRDIRVSFDAFAQNDGKISLVAEYNDQSEDRRGVIEIDNVILFVFEARYSHYSNDAYEKQWYYIKDGHFFILPRHLINEIVIIDALSLSSQFDFAALTYMSTSDGFYVFYDDDTYDIFVASPYDFFNSYKLNKDGTFTYMFTSIFKKKYSVGDAYNGRVITAIV